MTNQEEAKMLRNFKDISFNTGCMCFMMFIQMLLVGITFLIVLLDSISMAVK